MEVLSSFRRGIDNTTNVRALSLSLSLGCGGCNPHVEIIRHRQHEKFKTSFYDLFRAAQSSSTNNGASSSSSNNSISNNSSNYKGGSIGSGNGINTAKQQQQQQQQHIIRCTISTIWKSIPPHTIWERFQFSLKTLEASCIRELTTTSTTSMLAGGGGVGTEVGDINTTNHPTIPSSTPPLKQIQQLAFPTVHQLHSHMIYSRRLGTYWEPLLPVPSIIMTATTTSNSSENGENYYYDDDHANNELRGRKMNERYRHETLQLLRGEIEFQFRRVFKKAMIGNNTKGGGDNNMHTLFLHLGGEDDGKKKKNKQEKKKRGQLKSDDNEADEAKCNIGTNNTFDGNNDNNERQYNDDNDKEDYILRTIFASQPFQKITQKLQKKFFNLAEEHYCAFLVEMQKCSNRLLEEERKQQASCVGGGGGRKKRKQRHNEHHGMPKITIVDNDHDVDDDIPASEERDRQVAVTFMGISLRINEKHRKKLLSLYERTLCNLLRMHRDSEDTDDTEVQIQQQYNRLQQQFPKLLFSLLLRYDALEGAGLQSAIPPTVFRYLHRRFGCEFECFASPFNCYWLEKDDYVIGREGGVGGRYGSAYGDTDAMFGSFGSFFDIDFLNLSFGEGTCSRGGCYQANPPFASEFIEKMYHRMHHFLTLSERTSESREDDSHIKSNEKGVNVDEEMDTIPLMFVVFVPAWSKCSGWKMLSSSSYLTKHVLLSQKEDVHYYAEGTQHRRKLHRSSDRASHGNDIGKAGHRIASFDTSVFFLQNDAAKSKWPIVGEDQKLLKNAFAMIPTSDDEESEEKKRKISPRRQKAEQSCTATPDRINHGNCTSNSSNAASMVSSLVEKTKKRRKNKSDKVKSEGGAGGDAVPGKKKKRLMSGGQDELRILASIRF